MARIAPVPPRPLHGQTKIRPGLFPKISVTGALNGAGNDFASNESYQMVNLLLENLNVSEQKAEQSSGEPGSLGAGPTIPIRRRSKASPLAASERNPSASIPHAIAPDHEAPKADEPRADSSQGRSRRTGRAAHAAASS